MVLILMNYKNYMNFIMGLMILLYFSLIFLPINEQNFYVVIIYYFIYY